MSQSDNQEKWSSDHPKVVRSTCDGRRVAYTGVDGVEIRDCAYCMDPVKINPDEGTVVHLDG